MTFLESARWTFLAACALPLAVLAQALQSEAGPVADTNDIPAEFVRPGAANDYIQRVEMIPMRDGVKLYTVIWIPTAARDLPIILTRTPYNAKGRTRGQGPTLLSVLPLADEDFVTAGYIRIYQDVRGKHGSEGRYALTRHPRGPFNASQTDDATDAWDTVDWLVKNLPESNGKVGMIGSSYEGWTVVMALLDPHPALKAAVSESPHGRRLDGRRLVPLRRLPPTLQPRLFREPDSREGTGGKSDASRGRRLHHFPGSGLSRELREDQRFGAVALVAEDARPSCV